MYNKYFATFVPEKRKGECKVQKFSQNPPLLLPTSIFWFIFLHINNFINCKRRFFSIKIGFVENFQKAKNSKKSIGLVQFQKEISIVNLKIVVGKEKKGFI